MNGFVGVGALVDYLGGRVAVGRPVHLVLHRRRRTAARLPRWAGSRRWSRRCRAPSGRSAARTRGCRGSARAVRRSSRPPARRVLQPLVVHREALDQVLRRRAFAHWRNCVPRAADAEADGEDRFQTVKLDFTCDGADTLGLNCCKFCNSLSRDQSPPRQKCS